MDIGTIIYNRRKELKLTLEEIGNYVGVGKSTVKKWESGFIANMRRDKIAKLAEILQLNPTIIINGITESEVNSTNVLGERIKQLRTSRGLNQTQLSDALNDTFKINTDRVMISKWETGFQKPMIGTIIHLAKYFNVSIDYLNGNDDFQYPDIPLPAPNITQNYTTFPVVGEVAASYDYPAIEDWEGETVDIPDEYLKGRNRNEFFVLRVKGDSMYPDYQDGDKVLVLKQTTMNYSGQVGVVLYDGEMGTLKKVEYKMGEDWMRLVAINPSVPPKLIQNEDLERCRVLGIPKLLLRDIND